MVAMQEERRRSSSSSLHRRGGRHGAEFWKEEASNYGVKLMQKMGWKEGKGLGKGEKGTREVVKTRLKTDQRGVGAVHLTGDAKQNLFQQATTDLFNQLLTRLNEAHSNGAAEQKEGEEEQKTATDEGGEAEEEDSSHHNTSRPLISSAPLTRRRPLIPASLTRVRLCCLCVPAVLCQACR